MKKTLVSALTTALVVGAASTTFAAANPFSDVPADSWAYDAVAQLAQDGVINGYGDGTFRGENEITRYEMAQMVAKAMAKQDQVSAADKAMIDKLAAEFSDELNNLGVRVSNLEKKVDNVKFTGEVRYTFQNRIQEGQNNEQRTNEMMIRFEPSAQVNDHWTAKTRIDYYTDANRNNNVETKWSDQTAGNNNFGGHDGNLEVDRIYAEGIYGNTKIDLGKLPYFTNVDKGMIFDSNVTGAQVTFGKEWKGTVTVGSVDLNRDFYSLGHMTEGTVKDKYGDNIWYYDDANHRGTYDAVEVYYDGGKKFTGGIGYHRLSLDQAAKNATSETYTGDHTVVTRPQDGSTYRTQVDGTAGAGIDALNIWDIGVGYKFTPTFSGNASYAKNTTGGDLDNKMLRSWNFELDYKGAKPENKGSFGVYLAYRDLGQFATIHPTYDGAIAGNKGVEFGTSYVFAKNVMGTLKYFTGKKVNAGYNEDGNLEDRNENSFFGRVEFFF